MKKNYILQKTKFSSPDSNENPFFNCVGLKPNVIEKRLKWIAGITFIEMPKLNALKNKIP